MKMQFRTTGATLALAIALMAPTSAMAVDVCGLLNNAGFESGNISNWSLTQPNSSYVNSLGSLNPSIDPADPGNNPATLAAPVGSYFTGVKDPDDIAPDLKYKLVHSVIPVNYAVGTVLTIQVWANRGRLEPYDTPASGSTASVKIFGWNAGATPSVNSSDNPSRTITWNPAAQSFTSWASDGSWASQTFTFTITGTQTIRFLTVSLTGQNMNHHNYVAMDACDAPVPVEPASWGAIKALYQ